MADYDLIIIGGGPAGLTAGLYAARANMRTVLFEAKDIGGELLNTDLIEDWPGEESVTGRELAEKMRAHATKFGLTIQTYSPVKTIRSEGDWKLVVMDDGTVHRAYAVIVTVGGVPTKLDVPGETEFHGRGVSYCAVCDGAFFKGEDLAVIGGGDSAFQEGLFLTRFAKNLSLVHRRNDFRAQSILQDRLLGMDNVIGTPHGLSHADESLRRCAAMTEENVLAIVEGRMPPYLVNRQVRWRVLQEA